MKIQVQVNNTTYTLNGEPSKKLQKHVGRVLSVTEFLQLATKAEISRLMKAISKPKKSESKGVRLLKPEHAVRLWKLIGGDEFYVPSFEQHEASFLRKGDHYELTLKPSAWTEPAGRSLIIAAFKVAVRESKKAKLVGGTRLTLK